MHQSLSHGTEVGFAYTFVDYTEITVMSGTKPVAWLRTVAPEPTISQRRAIRSRWIYAFRFGAGPWPTLACEVWIDDQAKAYSRPGAVCQAKEPEERGAGALASGVWPLPRTVNGLPTHWMFLASGIRLDCASLRALCRFQLTPPDYNGLVFASDGKAFIPVIDPSKKECQFEVSDSRLPALPAIDFMVLGNGLRLKYERACNDYLREIVPVKGMSEAETTELQRRVLTYTLAKTVEQVVDHDSSMARKVRTTDLFRLIKGYETMLAQLKVNREQAACRLRDFHNSPEMEMVRHWHLKRETAVMDHWVEYVAAICERLDQSVIGRAYLNDPPPFVLHILESYAFPIDRPPIVDNKKWASIVKKSVAPITSIWSKFLPWYLGAEVLLPTPSLTFRLMRLETAIARINWVLEEEVLHLRMTPKGAEVPGSARPALAKVRPITDELPFLEIREDLLKKAEAAKAKTTGAALKRHASIATSIQLGADSINNAFKLMAFMKKTGNERTVYDYADAAGAVNSMLKGFLWDRLKNRGEKNLLGWIGARAARGAAGVTAVADAIAAYKDFEAANADDDTLAAVMNAISGSSAVAIGLVSGVLPAIALANPGLLLALLAIQGVSFAVGVWCRDDSLANFLEHSTFGTQFGQSDKHPTWADGSYRDWCDPNKGVEQQITTIYNLLTTFKLKAYNPVTVDMHLGYYEDDMKVEATFYAGGTQRKVKFYPAFVEQEVIVDDALIRPLRKAKDRPTALRLTFDRTWRSDRKPEPTFCRVQITRTVTIAGKEVTSFIPPAKNSLSEDEIRRFGKHPDLISMGHGIAYPLAGSSQPLNPETKSSS